MTGILSCCVVQVNNTSKIKIYILFCSVSSNLVCSLDRLCEWHSDMKRDYYVWNKYDKRTAVRNCVLVPGAEMWHTRICCCYSSFRIETKESRGWRVRNWYWGDQSSNFYRFFSKFATRFIFLLCGVTIQYCATYRHVSHNIYGTIFQENLRPSSSYLINFALMWRVFYKLHSSAKRE